MSSSPAIARFPPDPEAPKTTDTAVVFVSGLAEHPDVEIARLPLLHRSLFALARTGVRRCFVAGAPVPLQNDSRYPAEMIQLPEDAAAAVEVLHSSGVGDEQLLLCLHATVVVQPAVLARLAAADDLGTPLVVNRPLPGGTVNPIALASMPMSSLPALWPALRQGDRSELERLANVGEVALFALDRGFATQVEKAADIPQAEHELLLALENPRDGRIDTLLNRKLSRPISRVFLDLPVHPNHITVLGFLCALVGAFAFAQGTYFPSVAGALLLQLAAVLDCSDGEVARVKFLESRLGDILDITLDAIANAAIFVGIARGAWATGRIAHAYPLGLATAVGILGAFVVVTYAERCLPETTTIPAHRRVQQLVSAMTTRDFSVIVLAAAVVDMLPWFLWGAAIGANVFWALLLVLLIRGNRSRQVGK